MFFVSQPVIPCDISVRHEYVSESLRYETLINRIFEDLSAAFGFGGMIHEISDDYSPVVHQHQYNVLGVKPSERDENCVPIATFVINGKKIRLFAPAPFTYKEPDPAIGELKFIAAPTIAQPERININSPDFDGWVYPAGQVYYV